MTAEEAMTVATPHAARLSGDLAPTGAEQRFIELTEGRPPDDVLVHDCLVWVVRFAAGPRWLELAVRDADGTVVRVERSRSFQARGPS